MHWEERENTAPTPAPWSGGSPHLLLPCVPDKGLLYANPRGMGVLGLRADWGSPGLPEARCVGRASRSQERQSVERSPGGARRRCRGGVGAAPALAHGGGAGGSKAPPAWRCRVVPVGGDGWRRQGDRWDPRRDAKSGGDSAVPGAQPGPFLMHKPTWVTQDPSFYRWREVCPGERPHPDGLGDPGSETPQNTSQL